jgi:hypothetical protein
VSVTVTETQVVVQLTDPETVVVSAPGPQGAVYLPSRAVTVLYPTAAEDITLMRTDREMVVSSIVAHVSGSSPSVTYSLRFDADRSAAGTEVVVGGSTATSTTTGNTVSAFSNATIPSGAWIWLTTTASSGTVTAFHMTAVFQ